MKSLRHTMDVVGARLESAFSVSFSWKKLFFPRNYLNFSKRLVKTLRGNVFSNDGPITDADFEQIKNGIEEVKPRIYVELGTGTGVSTTKTFQYLQQHYPECHFYTVDIAESHYRSIKTQFGHFETFHPLLGLTIQREEAGPPADGLLKHYTGPTDVLRRLLSDELRGQTLDIVFIDSIVGTAAPEFVILQERLSPHGIIFCHDILNNGKGVEVLEYLENNRDQFSFEVIDTGPYGMIKIRPKGEPVLPVHETNDPVR